jgi:hypothetical protein
MSRILLLGAGGPASSGPALWTPNDDASLVSWFDLSNPASWNSGTGTWTAKFGAKTFVKDSTGPTYSTTGIDGSQKVLTFTGMSDTGFSMANPGIQSWVMAAVIKITVAAAASPALSTRGLLGLGVAGLLAFDFGGGQVRYAGTGNEAEFYDPAYPNTQIWVCRFSSSSRIVRLNGTEKVANSVTNSGSVPATTDSIRIMPYAGSAVNAQMEVACLGIFNSTGWSNALAEKIEGYIAHNGLGLSTSVLPGGHTYKSAAPTV